MSRASASDSRDAKQGGANDIARAIMLEQDRPVHDGRRDEINLTTVVVFDHAFEGKSWKCRYSVAGDHITVIADGTTSIACLEGMRPERLASVLAREILVAASFRLRLNPGLTRLEDQPSNPDSAGQLKLASAVSG